MNIEQNGLFMRILHLKEEVPLVEFFLSQGLCNDDRAFIFTSQEKHFFYFSFFVFSLRRKRERERERPLT